MTRFRGAWHPRWNRVFVAGAFVASAVTGASLGLDQRHEPVALASAVEALAAPAAAPTRLLNTHATVPFFVAPQPAKYTPYGTRVSIPAIGTPAGIELTNSASENHRVMSCDLVNGTITETIFVVDENGQPVSGASVAFTVTRSDVEEPQLVSDVTGFDGSARVSVKTPVGSGSAGASRVSQQTLASYSILAEASAGGSATPTASVRFTIADYTCTGGAGVR